MEVAISLAYKRDLEVVCQPIYRDGGIGLNALSSNFAVNPIANDVHFQKNMVSEDNASGNRPIWILSPSMPFWLRVRAFTYGEN